MRWIILASVLGGCLRTTSFTCSDDPSCGASGTCESTGYCSVPDPACDGNRYVDSAGPYAGQCVSAVLPHDDASIGGDGPKLDAAPDAAIDIDAPDGCDDFMPYVGLTNGHTYKQLAGTDDWMHAKEMCEGESPGHAYLAIPDDATELAKLDVDANNIDSWVGIHRMGNSPTNFVNVLGLTQTYKPWAVGGPDNSNGKDCVRILNGGEIQTDSCNQPHVIICECAP